MLRSRYQLLLFLFPLSFAILLLSFFSRPRLRQNTTSTPEILGTSTSGGRRNQAVISITGGGSDGYLSGGIVSLASTSEPSITFTSYNYSGQLDITLYQANKDLLLKYLLHDDKNQQLNRTVDYKNLPVVASFTKQITKDENATNDLVLPLSPTGIWYLNIKSPAAEENAFVVRSSFGVLTKEYDAEYLFWAQRFSDLKRSSGGLIKTYDLTNQITELNQGTFDDDGLVKLPIKSNVDIAIAEKDADFALVPLNLSYLNESSNFYKRFVEKRIHNRFFVFTDRPLYKPGDRINFKAIIRSDDDAHYKLANGTALVKINKGWDEKDTIFEKTWPITDQGSLYGDFVLPETVTSGDYQLKISTPDKTNTRQSFYETDYSWESTVVFKVEPYRKPDYYVDVTTGHQELIAGDNLTAKITGKYFSGQPLAGQEVKYRIFSSDYYDYGYAPDLDEMTAYRWGNWYGETVNENVGNFNSVGELVIDYQIPSDKNGKTRVLTLESEFTDASGNPSLARKNLLVYPGDFSIYQKDNAYGFSVGTDVATTYFLKANKANANLRNINLEVTNNLEYWVSFQEANKKYPTWEKKEEKLPDASITTGSNGEVAFRFRPTKSGLYLTRLVAKDKNGNTISKAFTYWVSDKAYVPYNGYASGLTIKTDKSRYQIDETVKLGVTSQTENRDVLLTVERERVNRYQVFAVKANLGTIDLPLVDTDLPNIFATISSFNQAGFDDDSTAVALIKDTKKITVNLKTDRSTYGPGDTVKLSLTTLDSNNQPVSAETAVWAVDKALFELSDQKPPSVFNFFWKDRWNSTSTSHSLEGISARSAEGGGCFTGGTPILMTGGQTKPIAQVKIGDTLLTRVSEQNTTLATGLVTGVHQTTVTGLLIINGTLKTTPEHILYLNGRWQEAGNAAVGDYLTDSQGQKIPVTSLEWVLGKTTVYNLTVDKYHTFIAGNVWVHNQKGDYRSVFKDTAYWNPAVRTDAKGQAQITFKLPDNLTTWVITGLSATTTTLVGQQTAEVVVTKSVAVRPVLPNLLRVGDKVEAKTLVNNFTDTDQKFKVSLSFDLGKVDTAPEQLVTIPKNSVTEVTWQTSVDRVGEGTMVFSAKIEGSEIGDTVESKIPIIPFGFTETKSFSGVGNTTYPIKLSPDAVNSETQITLSLSSSLLGSLPSAMSYLIDYPYGCVEQTTSRLVPLLVAKKYRNFYATSLADYDIDKMIKAGLAHLAQQQLSDGGWSWWHDQTANPFVTAYVTEALIDAKKLGFTIDSNSLSRAKTYLDDNQPTNIETQVAKYYGRSLFPNAKQESIKLPGLSPDLLSLLVLANLRTGKTNPGENGLTELLGTVDKQGNSAFWSAGSSLNFGSKEASTALAIRAIVLSGTNRELAAQAVNYLVSNRRLVYWWNTFSTAQAVRSLTEYVTTANESTPDYNYQVNLDGQNLSSGLFTSSDNKKSINITTGKIAKTSSNLSLTFDGKGQLYSTLIQNEFRTDQNAAPVTNGLTLTREFRNTENGRTSIKVGDLVEVRLTVSGLKTGGDYGLLTDELPAGLVPVIRELKNETSGTPEWYDSSSEETTRNGMNKYLYNMSTDKKTYIYKARAILAGTFLVPPAQAFLMYSPEVYGRTAPQMLTIKPGTSVEPADNNQPDQSIPTKPQRTIITIILVLASLALLVGIGYVLYHHHQSLKSKSTIPHNETPPTPPV